MKQEALAHAIERLTAFRARHDGDRIIDEQVGLTVDDLDMILARLHETGGMAPIQDMQLDDGQSEPAPTRWFNEPSTLSDADIKGEHGAMQDGVDDHRKDALADELDRRGLESDDDPAR